VGAEPAIVTDGLNFGNPDKPDRYWQFRRCVEGIAEACRALDLPVVSGNVSFYKESPEGPIHPTPIIGMLGTLPDASRHATSGFKAEGDLIYLIGPTAVTLGGSEYLAVIHGQEAGRPVPVDLDLEARVQGVVRELIREGLLQSAHDCAEGGLAVALAEGCIGGGVGCSVFGVRASGQAIPTPNTEHPTPNTSVLFGEGPSRIVVSVRPEARAKMEAALRATGVPWERLGAVGGPALVIDESVHVAVSELEETWERALPELMAPGRRQATGDRRQ
jgi:phosphoribosylformylglycinamidine synthase